MPAQNQRKQPRVVDADPPDPDPNFNEQEEDSKAVALRPQNFEISEELITHPPMYMRAIDIKPGDSLEQIEAKAESFNIYKSGKFYTMDQFIGRDVTILGCMIYTHPYFTSQKTQRKERGYDEYWFLTNLQDTNPVTGEVKPIIVKSFAKQALEMCLFLIHHAGWFYWGGQTFTFHVEFVDGQYFLTWGKKKAA